MESNHKFALNLSYYLSCFDKIAYEHLGFGKQQLTHKRIGEILGINPNTIQNWRDQFDPIHGNRKGWYQREMTQSRLNFVRALVGLNESDVRGVSKINPKKIIYTTIQINWSVTENQLFELICFR